MAAVEGLAKELFDAVHFAALGLQQRPLEGALGRGLALQTLALGEMAFGAVEVVADSSCPAGEQVPFGGPRRRPAAAGQQRLGLLRVLAVEGSAGPAQQDLAPSVSRSATQRGQGDGGEHQANERGTHGVIVSAGPRSRKRLTVFARRVAGGAWPAGGLRPLRSAW